MQLTKHISHLLYRYDCVTVPGFGSFLGTPTSAKIDTKNEKIYPPTKQISFNSQLQSNDGLLANAVSIDQQTSYEQAVRLIHKEVVGWKAMLHNGKKINLERLGHVHLNAEKNMVFTPSKDHNHLADSFGLFPVKAQKVDRTKLLKGTPKVIDFSEDKKQSQSQTKNPLNHVAAAAIAVVVGYAGLTTYNDYSQDQRIAQEEQLREEAKQEVHEAVFDLGELPSLSINTIPQEQFHVIGGAFAVEANANRFLKQLQGQGYVNAQKLSPNKSGLHMVALGSRVDHRDAIDFLRKVQRSYIADAWMLKR